MKHPRSRAVLAMLVTLAAMAGCADKNLGGYVTGDFDGAPWQEDPAYALDGAPPTVDAGVEAPYPDASGDGSAFANVDGDANLDRDANVNDDFDANADGDASIVGDSDSGGDADIEGDGDRDSGIDSSGGTEADAGTSMDAGRCGDGGRRRWWHGRCH